ncbi:MAG: redoxin domain-containing protein [Phycisphaerales bacterium]|nr:redoxin domain-containing protein [Phycisphaerales bacterium]
MANETLTVREKPIQVGMTAPDFTLTTQDRAEWMLGNELKKGEVVLCFYPLDFSPVCSTEMKCVTEEMDRWTAKSAQVVGISCDSFYAHKAWAAQLGLKQTLLADMHRAVSKAYGFFWPDLNVSTRGTVVIGRDGNVKWVQAREPKNAMNLEEMLAAIG